MNPASKIQKLLHEAVAHHQAGRLSAAEVLYAKVIKIDPRNADALHLMGVIAHSGNDIAKAKKYFERAIESAPNVPDIRLNFGNLLAAMDDLEGAQAAYSRAIALKPAFFDAQLGLGGIFFRRERFEDAVGCFRNAVALSPQDSRGHYNLGQSLLRLARRDEAETSFRRAVELSPIYLEAHVALGDLYAEAERIQDAIFHSRRAVALKPTPEFYSGLGELYRQADDLEAALAAHEAAVKAKSDDPVILHNYGAALYAARHLDQAQQVFERAIGQDPVFVKGYEGLAKIFEHREQFDTATALLEKALTLEPESPDIIFKLSYLYLVQGNFRQGWRNYEYRFLTTDKRQKIRPVPPAYWAGQDLKGKSILVWMEQGIGDQILYGSMIPEIAAQADRCIVECNPRLVPIFARSFPQAAVTAYQQQAIATTSPDGIDYQLAVASLGMFLRPDFSSFPRRAGFLKADPTLTAELHAKYRAAGNGNLVVGLSWRSANKEIGKIKTAQLLQWADLLRLPSLTFVNLQYGDCRDELAAVKQALGVDVIQDPNVDPLKNMDVFFAQVAAMDLVISTSNSTVHVAGSLGVPVWLLLLGSPGNLWYWFRHRRDSPWYSSLEIFRGFPQGAGKAQDSSWSAVLVQIVNALATFRPQRL